MIIHTYQAGVARKLVTAVADPTTHLIVDHAVLPSLGPLSTTATAANVPVAEAEFQKALKGFVYDQIGVPAPLTLRLLPGLSGLVTPPGGSDMPLRQALELMEDALRKEVGPTVFASVSIVLTLPQTLAKVFDENARPLDRTVAAVKLCNGVAKALSGVWPQIGPWANVLGVAIQGAEIGKLVYLGCEAYPVKRA